MDEEISIIKQSTRREHIKNLFIKNKNKIFFLFGLILLGVFLIFLYLDHAKNKKIDLSNKFIKFTQNYNVQEKSYYVEQFVEIIETNDSTYAPLALFFLIDNNVFEKNEEINHLFDKIINEVNLETEIKNLIIYKKALFNFDYQTENEMLEILKPLINSDSFWKPHSLLLLGDYFLSKGENKKAADFYNQILISPEANKSILTQAQSRIRENFSE